MNIPILAYISSFIAMALSVSSYFFKKKSLYLLFQFLCIAFLILSYFFTLEFVAMIGLVIGLARTITFFLYERKERYAPIWWAVLFSALTIVAYFVGSKLKGGTYQFVDVLYVVGLCMYAFIFRIRDFRIVRFACLVPAVLSILYNILIQAPIFNTLSYSFELCANIASILIYYVFYNAKTILKKQKGNKNEQN